MIGIGLSPLGAAVGAAAPEPEELLLADGTFATSTGWEAINGAVITGGEAQFTYSGSGDVATIRAETTCLPNTTYRITVNMLATFSGGANVLARMARNNTALSGAATVQGATALGGTPTGSKTTLITTGDWGADTIYVMINVSGTSGTYRLDDFQLEIEP